MRRLVVNLPNTLDEWLAGQPNQNETVRKALEIYKGDITTDTLEGMRIAFGRVLKKQQEMEARFNEQYEMVEKLYNKLEELTNR
jgi:hypothetical protein